MKKILLLLAAATALQFPARAVVPEPDNIIYGAITLGGAPVTAAQTNIIVSASAQLNGPAIATYQMGSLPAAGNFYSLRITLESLLPALNPAAALSSQLVFLSVNDSTGVRAQASVVIGDRGAVTLLNLNGANFGQTTIASDNSPTNNIVSINETVSYLLAWRTGAAWPVAPANIPLSYAVRTGALWRGGGSYELNSTIGSAPAWWVNVSNPNATENPSLDSAVSALPQTYTPGQPFTVTLVVAAGSVVGAYGVEDQPPAGWVVSSIDNGGAFDAVNGKVKWGLFFDTNNRSLSYQVTPPVSALSGGTFAGSASFDGAVNLAIAGARVTMPPINGNLADSAVSKRFHIGLKGNPGQIYYVEASTNLNTWQIISTVTIDGTGADDFYDGLTNSQRFYKIVPKSP